MSKRMIINFGGLLLCVFFFVAPLVQCSQDSNLSATGLQLSTGTGNLMDNTDKSYPLVFVLLIVPVILVIVGFQNKSFSTLRNLSIGGLASQIIFMIAAYSIINSGDYSGGFELTMYNWLILAVYIGLVVLIQHCIKQEENSPTDYRNSSPSINLGNISPLAKLHENKKCNKCGKSVDNGYATCPHCGASDFD